MCPGRATFVLLLLISSSARTSHLDLEEEEQREFSFVAAHKTGNTFAAGAVRRCLVPLSGREQEQFLATTKTKQCAGGGCPSLKIPLQWGKIVLMVRNPYEMMRSNYLYSMDCEHKPDCQGENSMTKTVRQRIEDTTLLREKPRLNEMYNTYIKRVGMADGVMATMLANQGVRLVQFMEKVHKANAGLERVLTVCLGDIFGAFNKTTSSILQHIGLAADNELWNCLKSLDPSDHVIQHGTHNLDGDRRLEAMRTVKELDANYFGGLLGRSPLARLCTEQRLK